ncbi:helix-turn-helix domain-containing protein [Aureivirga sp. CE67]|uniref:helix-turn-helix domain-containing protein n=1 Tax=Aureivirga sp. CE67 TaxID=1788983 RepID=UPI0018CA7B3E|nr:helix-turn-helix domain-containing protein [Aureivirga sp. CE67]
MFRIADGYQMQYLLSEKKATKYLDSILEINGDSENNFSFYAHVQKGLHYYEKRNYIKALEHYIKSAKIVEKIDDKSEFLDLKFKIAVAKMNHNLKEEASMDFLEFYTNCKKEKDYDWLEKKSLSNLAKVFLSLKKTDSAKIYQDVWVHKFYTKSTNEEKFNSLIRWAEYFYQKENYQSSLDSLNKALKMFHEDTSLKSNDEQDLYYLLYLNHAKIYNNKDVKFLLKSDSIISSEGWSINQNSLRIYPLLVDYYKNHDTDRNINEQIKFTGELIKYDSVIDVNNKSIVNQLKKFYLDNHNSEKEKLEQEVSKAKSQKNILEIITVLLLVSGFGLFFRKKFKFQKKKVERKIEKKVIKEVKKESKKETKRTIRNLENGLSENYVLETLEKLNQFEKSKNFIKKKYTLQILAKELETNSTYLSKIINQEKGESFSNYINNLKISYITEKLEKDSKFRNYTIKALAEEAGFNTTQSFTKAFEKKHQKSILDFIEKLENS